MSEFRSTRRAWLQRAGMFGAGAFIGSNRLEALAQQTDDSSIINVRTHGAKGDGQQDDTSAFQSALDAADNNGGSIVFAPRGTYKISGTLTVPADTTLMGIASAPAVWNAPDGKGRGSVLLAYSGRGKADDAPFIFLGGANSTLRGLTIYYPEQSDPKNVVPYPWAIRGGDNDNMGIQDVTLINPYQGVDFGTHGSGRHYIRGLYGQPIKTGLFIDKCLDVGRIEDVHFWPFWSEDACLTSALSGEAFVLRQTDSQLMHNCFAWGYHIGLHLLANEDNAENTTNGLFTNISFDGMDIGIQVDGSNSVGVQIANLFIACLTNYGQTARTAVIGNAPCGPISILNGSFWGEYKDEVIRWSSDSVLQLSESFFHNWNAGGSAIRVTSGRASILGNTFQDSIGKAVSIDAKADHVLVANNLLLGNTIDNHGTLTSITSNL